MKYTAWSTGTENRMDICSDGLSISSVLLMGRDGCDSVVWIGSYRRDCVHFIAPDRTSASDPESPKVHVENH